MTYQEYEQVMQERMDRFAYGIPATASDQAYDVYVRGTRTFVGTVRSWSMYGAVKAMAEYLNRPMSQLSAILHSENSTR